MVRRAFSAMGTEVELLLDVRTERRERARLRASRARVRAAGGSALALPPRLGALGAQPLGTHRRRGRTSSPSPASPLEARERTGGRFDPTVHDAVVAAGYDRTFDEVAADGPAGTPAALWRRHPHRRPSDRARARLPARPRRHRQGLRRRPGGRDPRGGRACTRQRRRGHRRPRPAVAGRRRDERGPDHARPRGRRPRHLRTRPPPLAAGRRRGAPPDRPRRRARPPRASSSASPSSAPTAVDAEVLAKAVFLGAEPDGPAVLVTADGRTVFAGGLE